MRKMMAATALAVVMACGLVGGAQRAEAAPLYNFKITSNGEWFTDYGFGLGLTDYDGSFSVSFSGQVATYDPTNFFVIGPNYDVGRSGNIVGFDYKGIDPGYGVPFQLSYGTDLVTGQNPSGYGTYDITINGQFNQAFAVGTVSFSIAPAPLPASLPMFAAALASLSVGVALSRKFKVRPSSAS